MPHRGWVLGQYNRTIDTLPGALTIAGSDSGGGAAVQADLKTFTALQVYGMSALEDATWRNSELVGPYAAEAIRRVKERVDGGIHVSGSGTLVRALIADGLLDELHLFVFPTTRGTGPRRWSLLRSEAYDNGALYLVYRPGAAEG